MIYRSLYGVPAWKVRSPFDELSKMHRQVDRIMDAFSGRRERRLSAGVFPPINLSEDKDHYFVCTELPGIKADQIDIQVTGKNLSLMGELRIAKEGDGVRYHRREREGGSFSRVIALPGDINADKVEAHLENGILTVKIAKAEESKPRQIEIRV